MRTRLTRRALISAGKAGAIAMIGSSLVLISQEKVFAETPIAPEENPPGDIPDTQAFIDYRSPEGFILKVPEGWARTDLPHGARFVDKLDGIVITVSQAVAAPTVEVVKNTIIPEMEATGRAVKVSKVESVDLPAGKAVLIVYSANSDPNPVTNKQLRLEGNRYVYFAAGKLAILDLYAPYGADNVDQWRLMSRAFRWQ
jgi:hypothetical protein